MLKSMSMCKKDSIGTMKSNFVTLYLNFRGFNFVLSISASSFLFSSPTMTMLKA